MKKIRLVKCVFLLFILCACTTQPAMQPESKNPITEIPEQAESQSTALEPGNSESREQAEVQDSQSENPAQAAFTGGITLYADSRTAYVNSEPVEMPAAPFVENGNFYIPLQFVAKTMGWSYQEQSGTVALASSSHQTTLTVGTRTIRVDDDEATVNSYDWQFPEEGAESDPYVPLIRDEIVFIPLDFLETRTDRDILSKLSFRTQWFPEGGTPSSARTEKRRDFAASISGITMMIFRKRSAPGWRSWAPSAFRGMHTTLWNMGRMGCLSMCCGCGTAVRIWIGLTA